MSKPHELAYTITSNNGIKIPAFMTREVIDSGQRLSMKNVGDAKEMDSMVWPSPLCTRENLFRSLILTSNRHWRTL